MTRLFFSKEIKKKGFEMNTKNGKLWDLARAQGRNDWIDYLKSGLAAWITREGRDPLDPQAVMDWRELIIVSEIPLEPLAEMEVVPSVSIPEEKTPLEKATEKLQAAKFDKGFDRNRVIDFVISRLATDAALVEDVNLHHKDFVKCWQYIQSKAREMAVDGCAFVDDDSVFEWALDYYYKDDAAEEAEKARKEAEAKAERERKAAELKAKREAKAAEAPVKLGKKDVSGQMDLMSLLATGTENSAPVAETPDPDPAEQAVLSSIATIVPDIPSGVTGTAALEPAMSEIVNEITEEIADDFAIPDEEA